MAEERKEAAHKLVDTLKPIPPSGRQVSDLQYVLMWLAGSVFIGYFMLGASLVPPVGELNLLQATTAMIVSMALVALMFTINSIPGLKYGVPMVVQLRTTFGYKGSYIPALIRAVPALFWHGIQTWIGALAINGISQVLLGYDNVALYFVLFLAAQTILSIYGYVTIKWVEIIGAIFLVFAFVWMTVVIIGEFGVVFMERVVAIPGTWGRPWWVGMMAFLAIYTTLMLNVSDYTRYLRQKVRGGPLFWLHLAGLLPSTLFMATIGLITAGATGEWNPIDIMIDHIPSTGVLLMTLVFITLAQWTTNLMLNVLPPANVLMEVFNLKWKPAAIIVGVVVIFTFPWVIVDADVFFLYMQIYSVFLGPIFGVMVVDYWIIKKQAVDLPELYNAGGKYNYIKGYNPAALASMVIGSAIAIIDIELSWFFGAPAAAIAFYILQTYLMNPKLTVDLTEKVDVEELSLEELDKLEL